jgi:hypothetical protein
MADRRHIFVLQGDGRVGQSLDQFAILAYRRGVDVGGLEEDAALSALRQVDVDVPRLVGEVVALDVQLEFVNSFLRFRGRRE